jgi:hypothetical protein
MVSPNSSLQPGLVSHLEAASKERSRESIAFLRLLRSNGIFYSPKSRVPSANYAAQVEYPMFSPTTTVILTDSPTALVIGGKSAYNVRTKFVRIKRVFGVTL